MYTSVYLLMKMHKMLLDIFILFLSIFFSGAYTRAFTVWVGKKIRNFFLLQLDRDVSHQWTFGLTLLLLLTHLVLSLFLSIVLFLFCAPISLSVILYLEKHENITNKLLGCWQNTFIKHSHCCWCVNVISTFISEITWDK